MDDLTKQSADEGLHKVGMFLAKSVVGLVPGLGPIAAEVLQLVVVDPAQKRRDSFLVDLASRIEELERQGKLSVEELASDERVSALILSSVQIAQRTAGEQKFKALKSALVRGLTDVAERDRTAVALSIIDRITDMHIVALKLYSELDGELSEEGVHQYFTHHSRALPPRGLDPSDPFFPALWRDLVAHGLVTEKVKSGYGAGGTAYLVSPLGQFVLGSIRES